MKINFIKKDVEELEIQIIYFKKCDEIIKHIKKFKEKISFKNNGELYYISTTEIIYIEIYVDVINVVTELKTYEFKGRLYKILEQLDQKKFIQVSKSSIINIDYLMQLNTSYTSNISVLLKNNLKVNISRNYLKSLRNILKNLEEL